MIYERVCHSDDRDAWLEHRTTGIGASEAAAVIGCNPWSSPMKVYADKLGLEDPEPQSEAAYWGTVIEPLVANRFAEVTGRKVSMDGYLLRSLKHPWAMCTLDAQQETDEGTGGLLEIKCTSLYERWDEGVPPYVYAQVQHQFAVTGFHFGSVAVLFRGNSFHWLDVERDQGFIDKLMAAESEFWQRLQNGEPPEPDGSESCRKALSLLYPEDDGTSITLSGEFAALDEERSRIAAQVEDLRAEQKAIDNRIKAEIGEHTTAVLPSGVSFTYKADKRGVRSLRRKESRT